MSRSTQTLGAGLAVVLASLFQSHATASEAASYEIQAQQAFEQARQAIQLKQWQQAELLLERTLLLQPEHAQAMIEMATLLAQRGQPESAHALIQMLLQDPRTPPAHRLHLQQLAWQLSPYTPQAETPTTHSVGLDIAIGHSTNPLVAANVRDITLTPASGPVSFPLSTRPQSAATIAAAAHWANPKGYAASVQLQHVNLPQARPGIKLLMQAPLPFRPLGANMHWQLHTQRYPDGTQRHQLGAGAANGQTAWLLGWYAEPASNRSGWQLRTQHAMLRTPQWTVVGGVDIETSVAGTSAPPGAIRANARLAYRPGAQWQLVAHWQGHADTSAYSPLLAQGARRHMNTMQLNIEHSIGGNWVLRGYAARRWANIPLFGWADAGVQLGWVTTW